MSVRYPMGRYRSGIILRKNRSSTWNRVRKCSALVCRVQAVKNGQAGSLNEPLHQSFRKTRKVIPKSKNRKLGSWVPESQCRIVVRDDVPAPIGFVPMVPDGVVEVLNHARPQPAPFLQLDRVAVRIMANGNPGCCPKTCIVRERHFGGPLHGGAIAAKPRFCVISHGEPPPALLDRTIAVLFSFPAAVPFL